MGVFPTHAVGNGVHEKINLVRGYQRNDQKYITRDVNPREDLGSSQADCLRTSG